MEIIKGLNEAQRKAAMTTEGPVLVIAGAGSGKTRLLTHRIAYLIAEKKVSPRNILAVTFTNKAAGEMKERVKTLIGSRHHIQPWMGTFHHICVRILRVEIEKIGFKKNFVIYDDSDHPGDVEATGRRVPKDVACVYFARPPSNPRNLAYLDENYREIGAQAVDMIVDAIHRNDFGLPATLVVHFVDGIWREGSTVRPAAPAEKEGVDRHAGGVPGTSRSHRAPG